jgi:SAM-dependent methyltransferase
VLHDDRRRAQSFGQDAERYHRARPSYPDGLFDDVLDGVGRRVVDVGTGTGIAALALQARGCAVLGVEADVRMAALARRNGIEVEVARFEQWDPAGRRFDVVTAAQAWHWVQPAAGVARAAEVLVDGGRLALFWNFGALAGDAGPALDAVYERVAPELARAARLAGHHDDSVSATVAALRASGAFASPVMRAWAWSDERTRDEWLDVLGTHSDHTALPEDRRARLLAEVGAAVDRLGGRVTIAYETRLLRADRRRRD